MSASLRFLSCQHGRVLLWKPAGSLKILCSPRGFRSQANTYRSWAITSHDARHSETVQKTKTFHANYFFFSKQPKCACQAESVCMYVRKRERDFFVSQAVHIYVVDFTERPWKWSKQHHLAPSPNKSSLQDARWNRYHFLWISFHVSDFSQVHVKPTPIHQLSHTIIQSADHVAAVRNAESCRYRSGAWVNIHIKPQCDHWHGSCSRDNRLNRDAKERERENGQIGLSWLVGYTLTQPRRAKKHLKTDQISRQMGYGNNRYHRVPLPSCRRSWDHPFKKKKTWQNKVGDLKNPFSAIKLHTLMTSEYKIKVLIVFRNYAEFQYIILA